MAGNKVGVPRSIVGRVGGQGAGFTVGILDRGSFEWKVNKAVLNEGLAALGFRVRDMKLVGEVRAELFGVGEDQFNGAIQFSLDVLDGDALGV